MSEENEQGAPQRIVVALDPSDPDLTALHAAADIAARVPAELVGVFVEDIDLLRLAGLPFAQEFTTYARAGRGLDPGSMERTLHAQAAALRRAVAAAAERRHLRWSFRVSRGPVAVELLSASADADMVIIGRSCRSGGRPARIGSTARAVVGRSPRTVLVLHAAAQVGRPVLVVYDGTPCAKRALMTAAAIAHEEQESVVVASTSSAAKARAGANPLATEALSILQAVGIRPRVTDLASADLDHVLAALDREGCGSLVVAADSNVLGTATPEDLIERSRCPIVVVR